MACTIRKEFEGFPSAVDYLLTRILTDTESTEDYQKMITNKVITLWYIYEWSRGNDIQEKYPELPLKKVNLKVQRGITTRVKKIIRKYSLSNWIVKFESHIYKTGGVDFIYNYDDNYCSSFYIKEKDYLCDVSTEDYVDE